MRVSRTTVYHLKPQVMVFWADFEGQMRLIIDIRLAKHNYLSIKSF